MKKAGNSKPHVTFSSDLQDSSANIALIIGGKDNLAISVAVNINVHTSKDEIQQLFHLIENIEKIRINPLRIEKQMIKDLLLNLVALLNLNCITPFKEEIYNAIYTVFQNMINAMPLHYIEFGYLGYAAYEQERLAINQAIELVNRQLMKAGIQINREFTVQTRVSPSQNTCNYPAMPRDVDSFLRSIEDTDACKEQWEAHFRNYSPQEVSRYFSKIAESIEKSSNANDLAKYVHWKLDKFVNALARRTSLFSINIMQDMIKRAHSPVDLEFLGGAEDLESTRLKKELETQSALLKSPGRTNFNQVFYQFRNALSNNLQNLPQCKDKILLDLQEEWAQVTSRVPNQNVQTVQNYINQAIARLSQPLPAHLLPAINTMQADYTAAPALSRQTQKLFFISALRSKITQYPEKSYAECYRLTKNDMPSNIQAMLNERYRFRLFAYPRHRFKDFISAITEADIDYESAFPANSVL